MVWLGTDENEKQVRGSKTDSTHFLKPVSCYEGSVKNSAGKDFQRKGPEGQEFEKMIRSRRNLKEKQARRGERGTVKMEKEESRPRRPLSILAEKISGREVIKKGGKPGVPLQERGTLFGRPTRVQIGYRPTSERSVGV